MKYISNFSALFFLLIYLNGNSQSLPIDFETSIETTDFVDFDGGIATVIDNPQLTGINTSTKVAQIVRNGGAIWSGSKILLDENLIFSTMNSISMKVFTTAPVGTTVKFKLEGEGTTERDVNTTVSGEWETLTWDFTGAPSNFNEVVFMFDFGNVGDGSENSTFLFDNVQQEFTGFQIDFPVTFEEADINYMVTDFGGNSSSLVVDPVDSENMVISTVKLDDAATWAGTTIGTNAGFASNIPLSLDDSKMSVRVWSPDANIPVRLKVEDSNDPTHTCETETLTTVAGEWETLEFDFVNQAPGTESLAVGLSMGWTYNMASIFFNFNTEGMEAGEKNYFFDDVQFGGVVNALEIVEEDLFQVYPNPTINEWTIVSEKKKINAVQLYDMEGKNLLSLHPKSKLLSINSFGLATGMYVAKIYTEDGLSFVKLIKE